jgi:Cu/Ag efflux protein CusF
MKYEIGALLLACTTSAWAVPDWTQARIVKIEPERARVTLYHQPIKSIGMEAMTMSFRVGHKVRFTVTETNSHLVVDQMEPAK